jgi:DNA repair photolyase
MGDRWQQPPGPIRGRGASFDPPNRFETLHVELDPDARDGSRVRTRYLRDASRTVVARNDSPDVGFERSLNPYRGCEHGCAYCLEPQTPVLALDGTWRPIGEVRVGDELLGFDETPGPDGRRRLRSARVEAVWWSRQPAVRLLGPAGEVSASLGHRWLSPWGRWVATGRLAPGAILGALAPGRDAAGGLGEELELQPQPLEAVEPRAEAELVDLQTSTGTFFAAGLATHNCFARPTHEYLGFSAGLDFETKIVVKTDAPELLRAELSSPSWEPQVLALSGVTDPYQPIERKLELTRRCLAVLAEFRNPVLVVTKNRLVTRDADLLAELAVDGAAAVFVSITTLDPGLQRILEPRTSPPSLRLEAIERLSAAGIPVGVLVAPVVPALNDHEIPAILEAAARSGATFAGCVPLRLPWAVKDLFERWLEEHLPERKHKILGRIRSLRGGRLNDPRFGTRMAGEGAYAEEIRELFRLASRKVGLGERPALSVRAFRRRQLDLFGPKGAS